MLSGFFAFIRKFQYKLTTFATLTIYPTESLASQWIFKNVFLDVGMITQTDIF